MKKIFVFLTILLLAPLTSSPAEAMGYGDGGDAAAEAMGYGDGGDAADEANYYGFPEQKQPDGSLGASQFFEINPSSSNAGIPASADSPAPSGGFLNNLIGMPGWVFGQQIEQAAKPAKVILDNVGERMQQVQGIINDPTIDAHLQKVDGITAKVDSTSAHIQEATANVERIVVATEEPLNQINGIAAHANNATGNVNAATANVQRAVEDLKGEEFGARLGQINTMIINTTPISAHANAATANIHQTAVVARDIVNNAGETIDRTVIIADSLDRLARNCALLGISVAVGAAGTLIVYKNAPKIEKLKSKETAYTVFGCSMVVAALAIVYKGLYTAPAQIIVPAVVRAAA